MSTRKLGGAARRNPTPVVALSLLLVDFHLWWPGHPPEKTDTTQPDRRHDHDRDKQALGERDTHHTHQCYESSQRNTDVSHHSPHSKVLTVSEIYYTNLFALTRLLNVSLKTPLRVTGGGAAPEHVLLFLTVKMFGADRPAGPEGGLRLSLPVVNHFVDHAIVLGLASTHPEVTLHVGLHLGKFLPSVFGHHFSQALLELYGFFK